LSGPSVEFPPALLFKVELVPAMISIPPLLETRALELEVPSSFELSLASSAPDPGFLSS